MPVPHVCVLRAPGTNCDYETAYAFEQCGAKTERIHLFRLLENPRMLADFQILCIAGGFSYGDDIGAGVIFGSHLRGKLGDVLREFLTADKLALGICNGFQVLIKSGVLPGNNAAASQENAETIRDATLTWNLNGKYTARWVRLQHGGSSNVFLKGIDEIDLPIAHAEGRLVVRDESVLKTWEQQQQIGLRYIPWVNPADTSPSAEILPFPDNPNGSIGNIAAVSDPTGRVLGLMPHPERFLHGTQHPHWTRKPLPEEGAGMQLFRNGVAYFG